ncbi:MAG: hypothetical protein K2N88_08345 [Muribaculaceae bacterium]|nr:hypothetical protein [Muribaculaceae bacterium]
MKLLHLMKGVCLLTIATLVSCGRSGSSTEDCMIFGEVPGLYADYQAQRDKIEESADKSVTDFKKASAQIDELKAKYEAKIEEAAMSLNGKAVEVEPGDDFKVLQPINLTFKNIINLNSVFDVNGEIEAVRDVSIDVTEPWLKSHDVQYLFLPLLLIGCDENGAEVTKDRIGCFSKCFKVVDGKVVLPAGSKAELQTVSYNKNSYEDYVKVKTVKLSLDVSKM